ncbi:DUF3265 domain-containing protein [Vibrio cholerae]|nr:DUF3265 domain-containing protein [Vibrio cholerae]
MVYQPKRIEHNKLFKSDSQRVAFLLCVALRCVALRCVALRLVFKVVCGGFGIALLTP